MVVKMTFTSIDYQTFTLYREDILTQDELDCLRFMTGDQIRQTFEAEKVVFDAIRTERYLQ